MTVVGQKQVTYTYDNANRLTTITQGTPTVTIAYDDADRRTSVAYPNGNSIIFAYNAASELTSLTYKSGATVIGDLTYTYDLAGNRIKTGGSFARSGLPPALTTVSYNANNQQLTFGTNTETYDLNGNLATVTDAGITTTYTWNARNQLTGISNIGFSASFTYDSFGRRTGKTIQGTTTNFVYDGLNPVQEKAGATVTANLLTGLGIDEFFTRTDGVGVRALLPDALGSTVALGDGTGTLQTQYTYEPFGYATQTGLANTNSYKYTGREDDGTGLYYYRARYYHPRLQRFIAEDPMGFDGGDVNLYGYVAQNPVMLTDPRGLSSLDFNRQTGTLTLSDMNGMVVVSYPAGNNTVNSGGNPNTVGCKCPAPKGTFPLQPPINTAGSISYGPYYFPVGARGPKGERLDIARLRGIGIHGGRTGPNDPTLGCIRISNNDVRDLYFWYHFFASIDPITQITIH